MPMEQFSQHLLPSLLSLSSDPVANVRVLVAKALRQSVMEKGNPLKKTDHLKVFILHQEKVQGIIVKLSAFGFTKLTNSMA